MLVDVNHSHTVDAAETATVSIPNLNANRFVLLVKSPHPIRIKVTAVKPDSAGQFSWPHYLFSFFFQLFFEFCFVFVAVCALPVLVGKCIDSQDYHKRWYYDDSRGNCVSFIYSGCAGNQNNFRSYESCTEYCGNRKSLASLFLFFFFAFLLSSNILFFDGFLHISSNWRFQERKICT